MNFNPLKRCFFSRQANVSDLADLAEGLSVFKGVNYLMNYTHSSKGQFS